MGGGLELIRDRCGTPADAIRWACLLEATAPKPGNVYPGRPFADLSYLDFVRAAERTAETMGVGGQSFSRGILAAAEAIAGELGTNVNLGILLLLGPLTESDHDSMPDRPGADWQTRVAGRLSRCDARDARRIYRAINVASPGGMGRVEEMDLSDQPPPDLIAAMRSAARRDRIALNYANGFEDLFRNVVPLLETCIATRVDVLAGIAETQLRLLASAADTLIVRKYGLELARDVQQRADFPFDDHDRREAFDAWLREAKINPGTTADLIAAGLYVLLRRAD